MKKAGIVVSVLLGLSLLSITSCGKNSSNVPASKTGINSIEEAKLDTNTSYNARAVNLRQAEGFAIFSHSQILSTPNSSITGKVGLHPGPRSLISLTPSEVIGGMSEIYADDDKEITTVAFLTQVKKDIINAYNDAETRPADADKINLFNGNLGNKVLTAGVYEWKSRVTIPLDLKLEGNETDIFIFKIAGQLRIGTDVHVTLSGGAKAENVFWQVGDDALIRAKSSMVGTIISQQIFEMKEQASLTGRAFSKNDKIILDKNIIKKP